ncbi:MAG: hypothetical protein A2161_03175 [Candidatus Schekmanbacteria bacterium RBG_13_48_7]|uniref:Uncharacterized protein n=1 Tax=Candidatus Schekmanbacteria bacterium RBG_13_48_7 TaxID=1817878 RepID=A0A1F7RS97_9BACT|nr:MAG: hypothetical protein A2161_03175 [Candidatus Schekmanbacteria bacterium RBG_13_48_7]
MKKFGVLGNMYDRTHSGFLFSPDTVSPQLQRGILLLRQVPSIFSLNQDGQDEWMNRIYLPI